MSNQAITLKTEITQNDLVNLAVVEGYDMLEKTASQLQGQLGDLEKERQEKQALVTKLIQTRMKDLCVESIEKHNALRKEIGFNGEDTVTGVEINIEKKEVTVTRTITNMGSSSYYDKSMCEKTYDMIGDELDRFTVISKLTDKIGVVAHQLSLMRKQMKDISLLQMRAQATVTRNTLDLAGAEGKAIKERFDSAIGSAFPKQLIAAIKDVKAE